MKVTKINKKNITVKFETVVNTAKKTMTNANNFALKNTEEVITGTIDVAKQWQDVTEKALKGGFKLLENQQNIVFNTLESFKKQFVQGRKKITKVFA